MDDIFGQLETSIQARLDADTDFQNDIATLSDEEKTQKIAQRKSEEFNKELLTLKAGSEEATKAKELANNYKIRAEKAENALKDKGGQVQKDEFTPQEIIALGRLHEDDVDRVLRWAKANGQKINEALKDDDLKTILQKREEERKTAVATQTKGGARGSAKVSHDDLLQKAANGELPESEADINKLAEARLLAKLKK